MIKLYNSKSLKLEEFKSITPNKVNMYVCGPTVYNHAHIGNARPIIVFDTLRRLFEAEGYEVKFVSNYTDVDDKIIKRSKETGIPAGDIARKFEKRYIEDMNKLNVTGVNLFARATDHMGEIID